MAQNISAKVNVARLIFLSHYAPLGAIPTFIVRELTIDQSNLFRVILFQVPPSLPCEEHSTAHDIGVFEFG